MKIEWQYMHPLFEDLIETNISVQVDIEDDGELDPDDLASKSLEMFADVYGPKIPYPRGINTAAGVIPLNDNYNPYDFWIGHTDFYITKKIAELIKNSEGVEFFLAISPYRFKIAVGRIWGNSKRRNQVFNGIQEKIDKLEKLMGKQNEKTKKNIKGKSQR